MAKSNTSPKYFNPVRPNFWGMIRDIAIVSINKGQFPLAIAAAVIMIILLKLPSEDVSKLIFRVFDNFNLTNWGGWLLSFILTLVWYINIKTLRNNHLKEIDRIDKEKENLEQLLMAEKTI